jgi:hypothetical protein
VGEVISQRTVHCCPCFRAEHFHQSQLPDPSTHCVEHKVPFSWTNCRRCNVLICHPSFWNAAFPFQLMCPNFLNDSSELVLMKSFTLPSFSLWRSSLTAEAQFSHQRQREWAEKGPKGCWGLPNAYILDALLGFQVSWQGFLVQVGSPSICCEGSSPMIAYRASLSFVG